MFLNKAKLRKASSRVALLLATGSLLATGITPAHAADATRLYLSFEANDPLKAVSIGNPTFGGAATAVVTSTNTNSDVLKFTKGSDAWSGTNLVPSATTPYRLADATKAVITMDYFSNDTAPSPVQLRLQLAGTETWVNKVVLAQPGPNALSFNMATGTGWSGSVEYNQLVIYPNFSTDDSGYLGVGPVTNSGQVYEIDNVSIAGGTIADLYVPQALATSTLVTFEANDTLGANAVGDTGVGKKQGTFAGAVTTIVDAPAGGNGGKALKIVKAVGAEVYAGVNVLSFDPDTIRVTNGTHKTVTFNYYSPKAASPVRIELRGSPNAIGKTVDAPLGWSKITVDFTDVVGWTATEEFLSVILFPDFTVAAAGDIFYVDNLGINGASTPAITAPATPREATNTLLTFETGDVLGAAVVGEPTAQKPQGGFAGAGTSIAVAPTGGNPGNALKIVKNVGGQAYAGVNFIKFGTDKRVTNGTYKTITFNYHSSKANSPVRVEVKGFPDTAVAQTVAAPLGWSKLTFDFTNVDGWSATEEFTLVSVFPDYNVAAAGDVFHVDNLAFNGAVTPEIPAVSVPREATSTLLTFETADTLGAKVVGDSTLAKPEGGFESAVTTIDNAPAGGNGGKALKIVKGVGAPTYAGVNIIRFGADKRVTNATNKTITFNYYSPKATSSVRVELRAFPNALGKTVAAPQGWSKITVDFTDVVGWTGTEEFVSVILFPDYDVTGAGGIFYVDNLAFNGATTPAIPLPKVKPTVKTAAIVGGTAKSARTLTAGKGSWTGTATIAYTYKWYRCSVSSTKTATTAPTSSAKCATISGATKSTYKLASADVGKYVRVLITAKNSAGTAYSLSKTTSKVAR